MPKAVSTSKWKSWDLKARNLPIFGREQKTKTIFVFLKRPNIPNKIIMKNKF